MEGAGLPRDPRVAVVTGAGRGFGAAVVDALVQAGWQVVAASRRQLGGARPGVVDVVWDATDDDVSPLVAGVAGRPVELLVNNAGRGVPGAPLEEVRVADLLAVMDVNVGGVLRTCQALQKNLAAAERPLVVNVSSRLGSLSDQAAGRYSGLRTSYAYRISKAAQNMTSIALAAELGPHVRVVAVHPGELRTTMGQSNAGTSPADAASQLVSLVDDDVSSPSFMRVTGEDIAW